jgi:lipopolysaccharide export system protein LptC
MNIKTTLPLGGILVVFLFSFIWFASHYHVHVSSHRDNSSDIDGYMTNVHYIRTDETGRIAQEIMTPRAEHLPHDNTMVYTHPMLNIFPATGGAWHLSALHGQNTNGSDLIELWDDVSLKRDTSDDNTSLIANTESISAFPKQRLITSQKMVTIKQPGFTISGKGLKGNLNDGVFKLLSETQTQLEPFHLLSKTD